MSSKRPRTQLTRALEYANRGWAIIPIHPMRKGVCGCSKEAKCISPGKHPMTPNGVKDATTDTSTIQKWFNRHPDANIGIATGRKSNLLVIDIDPRNGGKASFKTACRELGDLPPTVTSRTGGGGRHLFFCHPGVQIRTSKSKVLGRGIDILSDVSFAVAPRSLHKSCKRYRWAKGLTPTRIELAVLPEAWLQRLSKQNSAASADVSLPGVTMPSCDETSPPNANGIILEGERNNTLTSRAGALHRAGIPSNEIEMTLLAINAAFCQPPLEEVEVRRIVESITTRYIAPSKMEATGDPAEMLMHQTLEQHFAGGDHILSGPDGRFWTYNGTIWVVNDDNLIRQAVVKTARSNRTRMSQSLDGMAKQVISLMRADQASADDKLRLGSEPLQVVNCRNGELWITPDGSIDLRQHRPESYLRHCLNADYDPDATCPLYDKSLAAIFQDVDESDDLVRHWHELTGYALQPRRPIPIILILHGSGSNGKTALMQLFERLLGEDLVTHQAIGMLESNRFASASLVGKLLLIDDDVSMGTRLPDGPLKKISEAKTMTAERKFGPSFNFRCLTIPVFLSNHIMSLADISYGMKRRLMVVPFNHRFEGKDRDPKLFEEIAATEMSGVLNRCIEGLRRVMQRNYAFQHPKAVTAATAKWINQANPIPAFIEECCIKDAKVTILARELYESYTNWAVESGITLRQQQKVFTRNVEHLDFKTVRRNRGITFIGLRLK